MLPLAEVMDKMPLRGDVAVTTAVIALLLAVGAGWRPLIGTIVVLVAVHFIDWFGPSRWAMYAAYDDLTEAIRREDPEYFRLARSIPLLYLAGVLAGTFVWVTGGRSAQGQVLELRSMFRVCRKKSINDGFVTGACIARETR